MINQKPLAKLTVSEGPSRVGEELFIMRRLDRRYRLCSRVGFRKKRESDYNWWLQIGQVQTLD